MKKFDVTELGLNDYKKDYRNFLYNAQEDETQSSIEDPEEHFQSELQEEKRYHEKQFRVFKQQKMPMIGGGHGNTGSSVVQLNLQNNNNTPGGYSMRSN
jgi:hypothetical protein